MKRINGDMVSLFSASSVSQSFSSALTPGYVGKWDPTNEQLIWACKYRANFISKHLGVKQSL